ncbi:OpgC domain-containing protein, partial [Acidiphilium sp.]|uniref:OpgC domain-containing protein n=1 Tax=Acidiphilium sp. TaxID=527 RepID=UPI003D00DC9E
LATDVVAVVLLLIGFAILLTTWIEPSLAKHIPPMLKPFVSNIDKTGLHPYRLASILSLAWLASRHVRAEGRFLSSRLARVFVLIGQYGLPTYCASILLSYAGRIVMDTDDGWAMQIVVNLAGLAALLGVAAIAAWYRVKDAKPSVS